MSIQVRIAYAKFFRKIKGRINRKGNFVPFKKRKRMQILIPVEAHRIRCLDCQVENRLW
jgi:hypothetical protein